MANPQISLKNFCLLPKRVVSISPQIPAPNDNSIQSEGQIPLESKIQSVFGSAVIVVAWKITRKLEVNKEFSMEENFFSSINGLFSR